MTHPQLALRTLLTLAIITTLSACGKGSDTVDKGAQVLTNAAGKLTEGTDANNALAAVIGASEIPYPVYPNGTKYRVGGENGLKIVVFQTEDAFEKVDEFYHSMGENEAMVRKMAMSDYVKYSPGAEASDPWATHIPGIVIHEFDNEDSRKAVGASAAAKTNIIMSF